MAWKWYYAPSQYCGGNMAASFRYMAGFIGPPPQQHQRHTWLQLLGGGELPCPGLLANSLLRNQKLSHLLCFLYLSILAAFRTHVARCISGSVSDGGLLWRHLISIAPP